MPHPTTPEVALRALVLDDADAIAAWGADAEFCRAAGWTVGLGHDEHLRFQRGLISRPPADLHRLGVETEGRLVGYVALQGDDLTRRELGFVIGERSLWHHGLGTAAARAALVHGFTSLHLTEIQAEALEANVGSVAILRRIGMRETGLGEEGCYAGTASRYRRFAVSVKEFTAGQR